MPTVKAKDYPRTLFLVKDQEGRPRWYLDDPMKKSAVENEIELPDEIFNFVGVGDVANPVVVRLQCARIVRSLPFSADWPEKIRKKEEKKHFQDLSGSIIDIIGTVNKTDYPFNGVVLDSSGSASGIRTYNHKGECSDGIAEHVIVVMDDDVLASESASV